MSNLQSNETIGGRPVFEFNGGNYGPWAKLVKQYIVVIHAEKAPEKFRGKKSFEIEFESETYQAVYDGYYYTQFRHKGKILFFVAAERLEGEYNKRYVRKKSDE